MDEKDKMDQQDQSIIDQGVADTKRKATKEANKLKKKVMAFIRKIVIPMLLAALKVLLPIIMIIGIIALFNSILDGNGENEDDINGLRGSSRISNLQEYLRQFSHSTEAPQSEDGKFYKLYGDGAGWPTIGNSDLQWKSHEDKFACQGKVMHNDEEKTVDNVQEFVNSFLTRGSSAQYTDEEIDAMNIYIEKELVDSAGSSTSEGVYQYVVNVTEGLDLSQQQLYALTSIAYNFGHLPTRNGYTFVDVYEEGAGLYEINSWKHNRYIWDNWWAYVGGGYAGHVPARDAAFETYVKGVFDFSESDAGEVFSREYYIYYTQEQLEYLQNHDMKPGQTVPEKPITRTTSNEEEIFTYEENTMRSSSGILATCEEVMYDMLENEVQYSLDGNKLCGTGVENASNFSKYPYCCCATYVSVVLYRSGSLEANYINQYGIHSCIEINKMLKNAGWERISENEAEPGDICLWEGDGTAGHVFIYAGDGYIWDQHCGCISSSGDSPSRGPLPYWESYKNNYDLFIWRKP